MLYIIEGKNPVLELLKSGRPVSRLLLAKGQDERDALIEILSLAKKRGIPIEWEKRWVLDKKSPTGKHQGAIAYTSPRESYEIEDLLQEASGRGEPPLIVVLDGIEDPHNLGAIIRTAECAGAHGIVTAKRRAAQITASVASASAGAVEYVKSVRVSNIPEAIEKLKKSGVWVIGIEAGSDKAYDQVDYTIPAAIVIGSEGKGISRLARERCEILASIPMKGKISSLNASVAAAVVLFEAVRQRGKALVEGQRKLNP